MTYLLFWKKRSLRKLHTQTLLRRSNAGIQILSKSVSTVSVTFETFGIGTLFSSIIFQKLSTSYFLLVCGFIYLKVKKKNKLTIN